jgi:hypothetical protein
MRTYALTFLSADSTAQKASDTYVLTQEANVFFLLKLLVMGLMN